MKRNMRRAMAAAVAGVAPLLLLAAPAQAEEYTGQCILLGQFPQTRAVRITAQGPAEPVPPGSTFTLPDLTVSLLDSADVQFQDETLTLLGQTIDLGEFTTAPEDQLTRYTWGPMAVELPAPTEEGVLDIVPEGFTIAVSIATSVCEFPEATPFASVTVAAEQPPGTQPPGTQPPGTPPPTAQPPGASQPGAGDRTAPTPQPATPVVAQPTFTG